MSSLELVRGRRNLWCLSGAAESLYHRYCPSARGSTYDWQNCRQFADINIKYGLVRIGLYSSLISTAARGLVCLLRKRSSLMLVFRPLMTSTYFRNSRSCTSLRASLAVLIPEKEWINAWINEWVTSFHPVANIFTNIIITIRSEGSQQTLLSFSWRVTVTGIKIWNNIWLWSQVMYIWLLISLMKPHLCIELWIEPKCI